MRMVEAAVYPVGLQGNLPRTADSLGNYLSDKKNIDTDVTIYQIMIIDSVTNLPAINETVQLHIQPDDSLDTLLKKGVDPTLTAGLISAINSFSQESLRNGLRRIELKDGRSLYIHEINEDFRYAIIYDGSDSRLVEELCDESAEILKDYSENFETFRKTSEVAFGDLGFKLAAHFDLGYNNSQNLEAIKSIIRDYSKTARIPSFVGMEKIEEALKSITLLKKLNRVFPYLGEIISDYEIGIHKALEHMEEKKKKKKELNSQLTYLFNFISSGKRDGLSIQEFLTSLSSVIREHVTEDRERNFRGNIHNLGSYSNNPQKNSLSIEIELAEVKDRLEDAFRNKE